MNNMSDDERARKPPANRRRTTVFLGDDDHAVIARVKAELGAWGVENTSQAIRAALRFWDAAHPPGGRA